MQPNSTRNYIVIAGALAVILLLILIGFIAYPTISRNDKVPVVISVVPSDARVTINDRQVDLGTVYLEPGTYTIKASKQGFVSFSNTTYIDRSTGTIAIPLAAASPEAQEWAKNNQSEYVKIEGVAGKVAQEQGKDFRTRNPIVTKLPYKNFLYTIGYRTDPSDPSGNSIIIEIDAPEGYRQAALYQIRQWGYDPTDLTINFRGYNNPFSL